MNWAIAVATAASVLMFAISADGQPTTRSVAGTVADRQGRVIDGAVVQLKNTATLRIRSYITSNDGKYYFAGLNRDIDYELTAKYDGKESPTRTLSEFDSRSEAVIDLEIHLSQ